MDLDVKMKAVMILAAVIIVSHFNLVNNDYNENFFLSSITGSLLLRKIKVNTVRAIL